VGAQGTIQTGVPTLTRWARKSISWSRTATQPIDYPSRHDADAGLERGTISAAEHARIVARRAQQRTPPQDTALGGELGLHGEGPHWRGESAELDWTFGCVAVRDHEIDFLAQRVRVGTPVWIVP
jgi:hypothetical protein